jgi:hypothetical protein
MKNFHRFVRATGRAEIVTGIGVGLVVGAGILAAIHWSVAPNAEPGALPVQVQQEYVQQPPVQQQPAPRFADFGADSSSAEARYIADWIADSRDAGGASFVIIDKKSAKLYVFDGDARLRGSAPVLLGAARGDDTAPDIGTRPLAKVLPEERTTPAGRFIGERGHNARGEDVVWVDYDAAVSMHRVLTTNPAERRLERLATPGVDDNRISYGCVNVPVAFYEAHLRPVFADQRAIIYVLPDVKPLEQVFVAYDVAARHGLRDKAQSAAVATD